MTSFRLATFLAAFLLFLVQPMLGKAILPWFGGSPAVWATAVMFFQLGLLLGYGYAHLLAQWRGPRQQAVLHVGLVAASLLALPVLPRAAPADVATAEPVAAIVGLLTISAGAPFVLLSATSPLLQAWASVAGAGAGAYRLYALSNLGSLLALLAFPFAVEPFFELSQVGRGWGFALAILVVLLAVCSVRLGRTTSPTTPAAEPEPAATAPVALIDRLLWLGLPAVASVLLLAITNHVTRDIAAVPLLWVIPLALYLLSFVVAFAGDRWYPRGLVLRALGVALLVEAASLIERGPLWPQIVAAMVVLFLGGLACHGELHRRRPPTSRLTGFYLTVAAGGALGGGFVAVVAPVLFDGYYELHLGLFGAAALPLLTAVAARRARPRWALPAIATALALFGLVLLYDVVAAEEGVIARRRSFHGVLRVIEENADLPDHHWRKLHHGAITHGVQFQHRALQGLPTSYFGPASGVGRALQARAEGRPQRIGVIGLGVGTLASYGEPEDVIRFYELNRDVVWYARIFFSYLEASPATVEVVAGDARLALEGEADQGYDVLVVDAFAGDAIPVHLLTREAFALYGRHLRADGVLAVHVSNRYLDLAPLVRGLAAERDWLTATIETDGDDALGLYLATWVLASADSERLGDPLIAAVAEYGGAGLPPEEVWTDGFSNLVARMD